MEGSSVSSKCCDKVNANLNIPYEIPSSSESIPKSDSPKILFHLSSLVQAKGFYKNSIYNNTDPPWRSPKVSFFLYKLHCAFLC